MQTLTLSKTATDFLLISSLMLKQAGPHVILLESILHTPRFRGREQSNIYLGCVLCLLTGEQTEPLAGANVREQLLVMGASILRGRAGCIQAGGSPTGETLQGVKAFSRSTCRLL